MTNSLGRLWLAAFIAFVCACVLALRTFSDIVTTTFDFNSRPTGMMKREFFIFLLLGISTLVNLLHLAVYRAEPGSFLLKIANIPQKKYWLAAERVDRGLKKIRTMLAVMGIFLNLFWILLLGFLLGINLGVANITPGQFVIVSYVLIGGLVAWTYWYLRRD